MDRMQKDILFWAVENLPKPGTENRKLPNLVVIADKVDPESDFGTTLRDLKLNDFNVVAALPNEVACPYASSVYLWSSFFHSGRPIYQTADDM